MLKKIGIALAAVISLFLVYVAFQSPDYEIKRQITIQASPEKIFPHLNSSKLADKWGPWKEIDPAAAYAFSGPETGVGAKTSWTGGKQMGTGSATISEVVPNQLVGIKLEYIEPMSMSQYSEYILEPKDGQSLMTWRVRGKNGFVSRLMCNFFNMDKMVGGFFEKGLSNLKTQVETAQKAEKAS
jgi:hypothetical protein